MKKIFVLSVFALCLCGCTAKNKENSIQQLEIDLKGNPTTGYEWVCKIDDESKVKMISNNYVQDNNKDEISGVGGIYKFIFEGEEEGMTTINCSYARSFEDEDPLYAIDYQIQVTNDSKITPYSKNGTYIEKTIPEPYLKKTK